jgi:hypothetical protein
MTTPVSVRSATFDEVHDAASASTAWTAMYLSKRVSDVLRASQQIPAGSRRLGRRVYRTHKPWTLNDSNMISAVFSRFSGGLSGGSV